MWHVIISLGLYTYREDVRRGIQSSPLERTHSRTTSDVACHHGSWTSHTIRRCRVWHIIIALGLHTWSGNIVYGMLQYPFDNIHDQRMSGVAYIIALGHHTPSTDVRRGLSSYPLDNTHGRKKSGMTFHHRPWTTHMDGRCQTCHDIIVLVLQTWSDNIARVVPSLPFDSTQDQTTLGMACHHKPWETHKIGRQLGVAYHHIPWKAHTIR